MCNSVTGVIPLLTGEEKFQRKCIPSMLLGSYLLKVIIECATYSEHCF